MTQKALTPKEAVARLASYCATSEHAPLELLRKLQRWGIEGDEAEEIVEQLKAEGFVDEKRFAVAFVRDKYRFNGWGPLRLRDELRRLRIPARYIDEALAELEEGEHSSPREQVLTMLRKKLRTLPPSLERRKVKDRLMRYGLYRGYEYEDVREAVGYLMEEDEI